MPIRHYLKYYYFQFIPFFFVIKNLTLFVNQLAILSYQCSQSILVFKPIYPLVTVLTFNLVQFSFD